jgi:hypothetical protein
MSRAHAFPPQCRRSQPTRRAPWKRKNPRQAAGKAAKHLAAAQKATAKRRAKRADRRYPNLVDNMRVARRASIGCGKHPRSLALQNSR